MRLVCLCLLAAILAGPVAAQPAPQQPSATPEQIAAARAHADRLIEQAGASAWFENVTHSARASVRHVPSGMRCTFSGSDSDQILIFPAGDLEIPRGDDVGCVIVNREFSLSTTLYATRYPDGRSEQIAFADAISAIRIQYPQAVPFRGEVTTAAVAGDMPLVGAFEIPRETGVALSIVYVSQIGDWMFKGRVSGPSDDPARTSLLGSMGFANAILELYIPAPSSATE